MIIQAIQGAHAISHLEIGKKLQNLKNQLQVLTKRESTKEHSTSDKQQCQKDSKKNRTSRN